MSKTLQVVAFSGPVTCTLEPKTCDATTAVYVASFEIDTQQDLRDLPEHLQTAFARVVRTWSEREYENRCVR